MKTIVALVDFSEVATNVLKQVQSLAQAFNSHVTVLHGIPVKQVIADFTLGTTEIPEDDTAEEIQADWIHIQERTEALRACGIEVTIEQFREATVHLIVEEALKLKADVIVVGSHHHNAFYNLLVGSVTDLILKRAKCPVLVVPVN